MKGKLICFCGIDGSGKSTLAKSLYACLKEEGYNVRYVWGGAKYILTWPIIKIAETLLIKENRFKNYHKYHSNIKNISRKYFLVNIYETLVTFDYILQGIFKIMLPILFGKIVISDRYVYDYIAGLAHNFDYDERKTIKKIKTLAKFFPRPDLIVYVDVIEEVAYSRKSDIPSIEYLKGRKKQYTLIIKYLKHNRYPLVELDGSRPVSSNLQMIKEEIKEKISL